MWSRRKVIFVGAAGVVAAGAALVLPRPGTSTPAPAGLSLVSAHGEMLRAIAQALLVGALSNDAARRNAELTRVVTATAELISNLPPATRKEIGDLFALLSFKPARAMLGYSGDWSTPDLPAITKFLEGLRDSSLGLKQQAYFALHDLLMGSFYAEPATWLGTGYPGPPKLT
jgi:hypothetical protein